MTGLAITRIVWADCACRAWPVQLGNWMGKCGYCGTVPVVRIPLEKA